jgi:predicted phosphodiesterase
VRIALLSDIHGNPLALDAVLADIQAKGGVDGYWILGDLCAIGYDPVGVLERITALPNATVIRGNADRYVTTGERPPPTLEQTIETPALISIFADVAGSFGWTQGYLEARGWLDWLKKLPLENRLVLPDGTRVLLVHAAPGTDDGYGLNPSLDADELNTAIADSGAALICVGHFHLPLDRRLKGQHVINPGSVSNNYAPDLRAAYAVLSASENGYQVAYHRVDYDRQAAIEATRRSSNPGSEFIIRCLEGNVRASWLARWDGVSHVPQPNQDNTSLKM